MFADSMAFIGLQGTPPLFSQSCRPQLNIAHLTSVPPPVKDFDQALAMHETFVRDALSNPRVRHLHTRQHVLTLEEDEIGFVFGMQHAPVNMTAQKMRQFRRAGLQFMAIAYDNPNEYGAGFKGEGSLTSRGQKLIEWMAENDLILDLSHAGATTAHEALTFIRSEKLPMKPVASHSASYQVHQHPRNVRTELAWEIGMSKGYVGIPLVTFFLTTQGSDYLGAFVLHLVRTARFVGGDAVGVGSDCIHCDMSMRDAEQNFARMKKMLKTGGSFGEFFPDRPPELIEHGSQTFEILKKYLSRHLEPNEVAGVCGENFRSYLQRALPA